MLKPCNTDFAQLSPFFTDVAARGATSACATKTSAPLHENEARAKRAEAWTKKVQRISRRCATDPEAALARRSETTASCGGASPTCSAGKRIRGSDSARAQAKAMRKPWWTSRPTLATTAHATAPAATHPTTTATTDCAARKNGAASASASSAVFCLQSHEQLVHVLRLRVR